MNSIDSGLKVLKEFLFPQPFEGWGSKEGVINHKRSYLKFEWPSSPNTMGAHMKVCGRGRAWT